MDSDDYFAVRYLTKSRPKSRNRSNSVSILDCSANTANTNATRKLSNAFCNLETLEYSLAHLAKELSLLGFPFAYQIGSGHKASDVVNLVNITYDLIQLHKRNIKIQEELENSNLRTTSDLESHQLNNSRLKETIAQHQRSVATLQERERQLNVQNKSLHQKLKKKIEEVKRALSTQQQRDTQYLHDTRKRERETDRLKEKLQQLLSDRTKDRHLGMEMLNLLQRKDGTRGKWKTSNLENKQEDEMYQLIIKDFEERHRIIAEENVTLRQLMADINNELTSVVNRYLAQNPNIAIDDSSSCNSEVTVSHPEGQFNMPVDFAQDRIQSSIKDKFSLLCQCFYDTAKDCKSNGFSSPMKNVQSFTINSSESKGMIEASKTTHDVTKEDVKGRLSPSPSSQRKRAVKELSD